MKVSRLLAFLLALCMVGSLCIAPAMAADSSACLSVLSSSDEEDEDKKEEEKKKKEEEEKKRKEEEEAKRKEEEEKKKAEEEAKDNPITVHDNTISAAEKTGCIGVYLKQSQCVDITKNRINAKSYAVFLSKSSFIAIGERTCGNDLTSDASSGVYVTGKSRQGITVQFNRVTAGNNAATAAKGSNLTASLNGFSSNEQEQDSV